MVGEVATESGVTVPVVGSRGAMVVRRSRIDGTGNGAYRLDEREEDVTDARSIRACASWATNQRTNSGADATDHPCKSMESMWD